MGLGRFMHMWLCQDISRVGLASRLALVGALSLLVALGSMGCDLVLEVCEQSECDEAGHRDGDGRQHCLTECVCGVAVAKPADAPRPTRAQSPDAALTAGGEPTPPSATVCGLVREVSIAPGASPPLFLLHASFLI